MEFILAVLFVCAAHLMRVYRWKLFVETYEKPDSRRLVQALGLGYLCNFILPLRFGDVVRAFYAGKRMKNGRGFSLATVIVDRYLDILAVGFVFLVITVCYADEAGPQALWFYMGLSAGILILTLLLYGIRGKLKQILKKTAAVFNPHMEVRILYFFWSLIWSFKDIFGRISRKKLACSTAVMWILYISSYYCFARLFAGSSQEMNWTDVFFLLFAQSNVKNGGIHMLQIADAPFSAQWGYAAAYLVVSSAVLFLVSLFLTGKEAQEEQGYQNLLPYMDKKEKLNFLRMYFSDSRRDYMKAYLEMNRDILVVRDFSAGSNATTMLCMDGNGNFFRKYAFGSDGEKLYEQITWLQKFQDAIPLPKILRYGREENFCYYDMPYDSSAVGLFHYAHSMPKEYAWKIVEAALESMEHSLYKIHARSADRATVEAYIEAKVNGNLKKIQNAEYLSGLMGYEEIVVNGRKVKNLPYYLKYLDKNHLYEVFSKDIYSEIHGDLTIENIICTRNTEGKDGFYMIDPNTGNIHDSPNLDYGKLMQSIHGGYEFLMATKNVERRKNEIHFVFTKSGVYTYLRKQLDAYMERHFQKERIRSIYYHEVVHWLRLMPYKIEKDGKRVLLFYAGLLLVLDDVARKFEREF